jgi:hypothetical protein
MQHRAIALLLALGAIMQVHAQEDRVLSFPENYRTEFTRYYSGDRLVNDDQTIVLYANDIAVAAADKPGGPPSGAVLVAEIYAAKKDADGNVLESDLERRVPGEWKAIAVMERRDGWGDQYPMGLEVGNWEFELFSTSGKNLGKDTTACRACHAPRGETAFMFSLEHLAAANR